MHQGTVNCPHGAFFLTEYRKKTKTCLHSLYKQVFLLYNPVKGDAER